MEFEEYMSSLTEQIHDKRAKHLVAEEIKNHIEEQAEDYEAEGGNSYSSWASLPTTLVYNCIGFAVIMVLLYVDYNFIAKYAYIFYGIFMAGLPVVLIVATLFSEVGKVTVGTIHYGIQMLFPVLFAGIIYQNRNRGIRGIWICIIFGLSEIFWYRVVYELFGRIRNYSIYPALVESLLIMGILLVFAIWKRIFGKERKKQMLILFAVVGVLSVLCVLILSHSTGMSGYVWARITALFSKTENSYMNMLIKESVSEAPWLGGQTFMTGEPNHETYGLFVLNSIFTYFGKFTGAVVVAAYVLFLVMALCMSIKQSNRIGFLIGTACTISILVRFVAYLATNLGFGLWWTTLVPFLSYGRVSAVMNGIYIGLILCVYRNSGILREERTSQKRLPKIRLTIE